MVNVKPLNNHLNYFIIWLESFNMKKNDVIFHKTTSINVSGEDREYIEVYQPSWNIDIEFVIIF